MSGLPKTLITGGSGRLGKELVNVFPGSLAPTHGELELADSSAVTDYIARHKPGVIIHTAALTGIRDCENDRELAWRSNVVGTQNLVNACLEQVPQAYFVYVSTACVFRGDRGMYTETDLPYPKNFYSLTKLVGEYVVKRMPNCLIVRTNFVARERWPYPKAFTDRFGTYLFAPKVAIGIREVVAKDMQGVVHIVGDRRISMYELAKLTTPEVESMTLAEYNGPPLTVDMSLDTVRWKKYRLGESN